MKIPVYLQILFDVNLNFIEQFGSGEGGREDASAEVFNQWLKTCEDTRRELGSLSPP